MANPSYFLPKYLTFEEEKSLFETWKNSQREGAGENDAEAGLEARNKIIESYIPLSRKVAIEIGKKDGVPFEDLYATAYLTMCEEFDKFDINRGRFGTYILPRVKSALLDHIIEQSGPMKLCTTKKDRCIFNHSRRLREEFKAENPEITTERSNQLIAEKLAEMFESCANITSKDVSEFQNRYATKWATAVHRVTDDPEELETDIRSDYAGPEFLLEQDDENRRMADLISAFSELSERQRYVLEARFLGEEKLTYHEIAPELGVTHQRVQQIEKAAIGKLQDAMQKPVSPRRAEGGSYRPLSLSAQTR